MRSTLLGRPSRSLKQIFTQRPAIRAGAGDLPEPAKKPLLLLFEQSYLIKTIPVTAVSPDREIVKARKLYFLDNGIAYLYAVLSSGSKFENAVFNQLQAVGELSFHSLKTGRGMDFIRDKEMAIEVKAVPAERNLKRTAALAENLGIEKAHVMGRTEEHVFPEFIWG